jgi:formylglycine-generating enzyme required for sulfatase activity
VTLTSSRGRFTLVLEPLPKQSYRAGEGELIEYPGRSVRKQVRWERLPVSGVSYDDVRAYIAWLHRSGRVRGARICTIREWERAARGSDGRSFPHGDTLRPSDANFDETYGQAAFGPDEAGSFPASDSPFGIADLVGNVWEWTIDDHGLWFKGGSFYHERITALSSNVQHAEPGLRNARTGLRICADAAPAR